MTKKAGCCLDEGICSARKAYFERIQLASLLEESLMRAAMQNGLCRGLVNKDE